MKMLIIFMMLFSLNTMAEEKKDLAKAPSQQELLALSIKKGTLVEVLAYTKSDDTFELSIVNEPGVGPNIARAKDLVKVVKLENKKLKKSEFVGMEFVLQDSLTLIDSE